MPKLEVSDTVVLKANRQLVGIVDRTHDETNDPLEDQLIIAHVDIDPAALAEFVATGSPPKNYVFVRFANEAQGSSLVHEDNVTLLDRSFNLGDVVKQENGHMLGTVINVTETYTLQPVWLSVRNIMDGTSLAMTLDELLPGFQHICSQDCPFGVLDEIEHPLQNHLLHGIPGEELKKSEDILEADYVVQDDWLGVAEELEIMVVVMLEDQSVVIVKEPEELYIPVEDSGKALVSLPEFDNLARPDPLVALQGWSATIPPHDLQCGQMVITNQRNLRLGRWLHGQYNPSIKPQGRVLDVRTRSVDVRWLVCNPFTPERPFSISRPSVRTPLYDNISTFPKRTELRSNKQISIYDHSKFPRTTESRMRHLERDMTGIPHVRPPTDFRVGYHVKFRDQAGAALKYQGVEAKTGMLHGKFERIASTTTFGFDVNEFKIILSRQHATITWQDGTSSTYSSTSLIKFTLFEAELAPSTLVVAREGMKQVPKSRPNAMPEQLPVDFNEMKFFESHFDLLPSRVGVVQNVNQAERVAQVRWFQNPRIRLTSFGHVLGAESRFGRLSEYIEDVSLYEIMTFPALDRHLRDLVIIPPSFVSVTVADLLKAIRTRSAPSVGQASLSQINPTDTGELLEWLQIAASAITHDAQPPRIVENTLYKSHPPVDWVGEVVELSTDGFVTVRVNTRDVCMDVRLEHDQIICLIDETAISGVSLIQGANLEDSDMDMSLDGSEDTDSLSIISETVEYEGGERLDTDSGDENWEDADDEDMALDEKPTPPLSTPAIAPLAALTEVEVRPQVTIDAVSHQATPDPLLASRPEIQESLSCLQASLPTSEPPPFSVLDRDPPDDQFQLAKHAFTPSPTFLKRIAKEHRALASSLPKGEVFVRTYESRLDLMRCLILGPADTPYEHAPFLIDLQLGKNFPREPPAAYFHSWTSGLGRINPNLYEEGKICLSLLGTWPGRAESERWSEKATILQLLVSLQGLVFVRQPFYNEAGFEGYADDRAYTLEALRYNEKAYVIARGFVKHAVTAPVEGLQDVLAWMYLPHDNLDGLLLTVVLRSYRLIESSQNASSNDDLVDGTGSGDDATKVFLRPLSRGAIVMLRKVIRSLEALTTSTTNMR